MRRKTALLILYCLMASMIITATPRVQLVQSESTTVLNLISDVTELGPENAVGQTFTINCTIENVELLYGVDIQITWPTEYLEYVSHTKTIPRGTTYPNGILYSPTIPVKNDVDESASMPGSAPETRYWLAEASMAPAPTFNGTGTAFEMTFRIKNHPMATDTSIIIGVTSSTLANFYGDPIDHTVVNCTILLHGRSQPAGPKLEISSPSYKGEVPYTANVNVSILNLDEYWDLGGFDIKLNYNPKIMHAVSITIDPDGWFESFWPNGILVIKNETDNNVGLAWAAVIGIPGDEGEHTPPSGNATLFTVTFEFYASGAIKKKTDPFSLAGFPHPERSESPYENSDSAVPIPYTISDGFADIVGITEYEPLQGYTMTIESNAYVSNLFFSESVPLIMFNVTGAEEITTYWNVTIPKSFMWSTDGWVVLVDGVRVTPTIYEDDQNTYIYFEHSSSSHSVAIVTSSVIPEFNIEFVGIILSLPLLALALTKRLNKNRK